MRLFQPSPDASTDRDPVVAIAADENFAMPLAVTIRSVLDNLDPSRTLRVYVLDGGIRDKTKQRLERSWSAGRYDVTWIKVCNSSLTNLPIVGTRHINHTCYFRVLMPRLLPDVVDKAIHLDADVILCTDLGRMWELGLQGHLCLAAQDCSAPYFDSQVALANFDRCRAYLGSPRPIPNYRELGFDPRSQYFNAGILLVDIAAWRNEDVPGQLFACLEQNKEHVFWNDQYALNVVLTRRWGQLDPRWNQGSHIFHYPNWEDSPYDRESFEQQREHPFIVHFTTCHKPWRVTCCHPMRHKFFEYLERTDWAGWRHSRLEIALNAYKTQRRRLRNGQRRLMERARRLWQPLPDRKAS